MQKVLFDTNFLLLPGAFRIDIFDQLNTLLPSPVMCIPDICMDELSHLATGGSKHAANARIGIQLIKAKNIKILKAPVAQHPDDAVLELAKKGYILATDDRELRDRARHAGLKTAYLRKKQFINID